MTLRAVAFLASFALLLGGVGLGRALDAAHKRWAEGVSLVYLPPDWLLRHAALGHEQFLADYYWVQALQYYSLNENKLLWYRDLHRFIDLVVSLDPDFQFAYRFGAVAIPYNSGSWTWHNVPESNRVIERGLQRFPDDAQLWLQLGFNRGVIGTDYEGAALAYRQAARVSGEAWMAQLATRLYAAAGAMDRAREYSREVMERTSDPELKAAMERRLAEIELEETLAEIDRAIARHRQERGRDPESVEALVEAGYLPRAPAEPLGGSFYIQDGEARSTSMRRGRLGAFGE